MKLDRKDFEIHDQPHKMWAEGISDEQPHESDVRQVILKEGFEASDIDIWFDTVYRFWWWYCKIKRIQADEKNTLISLSIK